MKDFVPRLQQINDELDKFTNWLLEHNNVRAAGKLLPIIQAFALILCEMTAKEHELRKRRGEMSLVKKRQAN